VNGKRKRKGNDCIKNNGIIQISPPHGMEILYIFIFLSGHGMNKERSEAYKSHNVRILLLMSSE
jgi:hypothetical protein